VPTIQVFWLISMGNARKARCSATSSKFKRRLRFFAHERMCQSAKQGVKL
jgi:hypothetical protein